MFDKITYISDHYAIVQLVDGTNATINLMNLHIVFEDEFKTILGEVDDINGNLVKVRFLGEIVNDKLISGIIRKPTLDARIRVISEEEIPLIVGKEENGFVKFGVSPFYNDYPVYLDINNFFSNHFAIFGNSGSGKSCGITRLFQNMFLDKNLFPYKANILLFDASGEYYNAFKDLNKINDKYNYKLISTNENNKDSEKLRIPIYLLNKEDLALLLQVTTHSQLPIIDRMLKLARIFAKNDDSVIKYKNHLIAKAIMTIMYANDSSSNKRNDIFSVLNSCSTSQFNLNTEIQGIGFNRKLRDCFSIDKNGNFSESELITEYVSSYIDDSLENYEVNDLSYYTLDTLEKALNFTLISEGWLRNENTYGDAITLKVRLQSLINGKNSVYFDYKDYVSLENYLSSLVMSDSKKYQIININFEDIDDDFARILTKIFSRLVFDFGRKLKIKGGIPFHIVMEEAHRYVQNDTDRFLLGYNIFERIAKEGRKYGILLGLISQRPVELSDTVISQCSNFLIFKINHPVDVEYIKKMVPNISEEIVEKQKSLQSGTCLGFGQAFRIPLIVKMEMPDPQPSSGNCDVVSIWSGNKNNSILKDFKDTSKDVINANVDHNIININNKEDNNINNNISDINNNINSNINNISDINNNINNNINNISDINNNINNISDINNNINNNINNISNINNKDNNMNNSFGIPEISSGVNSNNNLEINIPVIPNGQNKNIDVPNIPSDFNGVKDDRVNRFETVPSNNLSNASLFNNSNRRSDRILSNVPGSNSNISSGFIGNPLPNNDIVKPTVDLEKKDDFGSVKIVPPTEVVSAGNNTPALINLNKTKLNDDTGNSSIPNSGKPLVNLIG